MKYNYFSRVIVDLIFLIIGKMFVVYNCCMIFLKVSFILKCNCVYGVMNNIDIDGCVML